MWFTWHDWITEVLFVPAGFMLVEKALVSVNVFLQGLHKCDEQLRFPGPESRTGVLSVDTHYLFMRLFFGLVENWNVWNSSPLAQYNRCTLYSWQLTLRLQDRKPITETLANCIHWLPSSIQWILKAKNRMFVNKKMVKSSQVVVEVVVFVVFNVLSVSSCWCSKF